MNMKLTKQVLTGLICFLLLQFTAQAHSYYPGGAIRQSVTSSGRATVPSRAAATESRRSPLVPGRAGCTGSRGLHLIQLKLSRRIAGCKSHSNLQG